MDSPVCKTDLRKIKLLDSYDLRRFLSDYRDLISWASSMESLICTDKHANDVTDVEALLERHQDIKRKKQPSFDDLADVASALMQVVRDKDAQALADKIEELTNRYAALVTNYDLPIAKNRNLILRKNIAKKIDKTEALRKPNMEQPVPIKEVKILKTAEDIQERRE